MSEQERPCSFLTSAQSWTQSSGLNLSSVNFKVLIPGLVIYFCFMFFTSELDFKEPSSRGFLHVIKLLARHRYMLKLKGFHLPFALWKSLSPWLLSLHIKSTLTPAKLSLFLYMENWMDSSPFLAFPSLCWRHSKKVAIFPVGELPDCLFGDF